MTALQDSARHWAHLTAATHPRGPPLPPAAPQATNEHTRDENRYGGTADAVRRIYAEEGAPGFFAGLRAKILQTVRGRAARGGGGGSALCAASPGANETRARHCRV